MVQLNQQHEVTTNYTCFARHAEMERTHGHQSFMLDSVLFNNDRILNHDGHSHQAKLRRKILPVFTLQKKRKILGSKIGVKNFSPKAKVKIYESEIEQNKIGIPEKINILSHKTSGNSLEFIIKFQGGKYGRHFKSKITLL